MYHGTAPLQHCTTVDGTTTVDLASTTVDGIAGIDSSMYL